MKVLQKFGIITGNTFPADFGKFAMTEQNIIFKGKYSKVFNLNYDQSMEIHEAIGNFLGGNVYSSWVRAVTVGSSLGFSIDETESVE